MSLAIGIDLGTTRCAVGVFEAGKAVTLLSGRQAYREASAIGVDGEGAVLVGERARRLSLTQPRQMLLGARRLLGRRFDELEPAAWLPIALQRGGDGDAVVKLGEQLVTPPELLAPLLRQVRRAAETQLGEQLPAVVVAVRGHLDDAQRRATLAACRLGGLEVRRLVHATTAAALVYQASRTAVSEELVAVIDFGGGGFDAALIEVGERGVEVLAQRGVEVGGDDLDARVVEWLQAEFREQAGVDGAEDPIARARMRDAAEKARVALSDAKDVTVHLPYLAADEAGPKHLQSKLTQARLEKLVADLLDRCVAALQRALDDAGRPAQQVAQVLMIGGCARMPALHGRVEAIFKKIPSATLDADEVVARGAAILAGLLASRSPEVTVQEALSRPLFLQVGAAEPTVLFARGAVVPAEHSEPVTTPGDGRPGAVCRVLEGDRSGAEPPQLLGFTVMGRPEVEVKFTLDASQVLELSVRELLRGKEARLVVEGRGGFAADVLATMVEAARAEEVERRQVREIQERRQRLEGMAQRAERVVGEQEKLNPEVRAAVLAGVRDARAVLQTQDDALVTAAIEAFAAVLRPLPGELAAIAVAPVVGRLQPVYAAPPKRVVMTEQDLPDADEQG
jgi:molecular chaperone DnaK